MSRFTILTALKPHGYPQEQSTVLKEVEAEDPVSALRQVLPVEEHGFAKLTAEGSVVVALARVPCGIGVQVYGVLASV